MSTHHKKEIMTTNFTFTVTRTGSIKKSSKVTYTIEPTSRFNATAADFPNGEFPSGVVIFAVGETSKTITVPFVGTGDVTEFRVNISSSSSENVLVTPRASAIASRIARDLPLTASGTQFRPYTSADDTATALSSQGEMGGSALADNGMVYGIGGATVFKYNPNNNTTVSIPSSDGSTITGSNSYSGCALAQNGMIYCTPYDAASVLKINPFTDTFTTFTGGANFGGGAKYRGAVLANNGIIYGVPRNASSFLKINTNTDTTSNIGSFGVGQTKFSSGALAPTGMIYMMSGNHPWFPSYKIDPNSDTITSLQTDTENSSGSVLAPNGMIYCIPFNRSSVIKIDPSNDRITTFGNVSGFQGGALGPNGMIYALSQNATTVLRIDPANDTISTFNISGGNFINVSSMILASDGRIYARNQYTSTMIRLLPTSTNVDTKLTGLYTGGYGAG
jgi:outer membrane protein assembly factor BamB